MRTLLALTLLAALAAPAAPSRAALLPQDDAGSGRDAPNAATASFRIQPGRVYDGMIEGVGADDEDWYAFHAAAGAAVEARAASDLGCLYVFDAEGTELAYTCTSGYQELGRATFTAPASGTYFLQYTYIQTSTYRFSLGVNAGAPSPAPVDAGLFGSAGSIPAVAAATQSGKHAVVAVVDTGINLHHRFFRAPALTRHPSTWLPGFPARAASVRLSLDAPDYAAARAADASTFASLRRSTYSAASDSFDEHLYTFPGTRVVGAISFGEYADKLAPPVDPQPIRDDNGHGTHSAGLAGGANLAAAEGNVLIVAVEVGAGTFDAGIRWAARQPWIDALSVSLGYVANVPLTTSPLGSRSGPEWATREAAVRGKPVFVASGNGLSSTGLGPDRCSTHTSPYTGPAWITRVGAAQPGAGNPTWWHCAPVDAVARTNVVSPASDRLTGGSNASGTSASTPNVAGHFAHLLLGARRARSAASRLAVLDHLLRAAQPVPLSPGAGDPSVYPLSLADQGYGLVDQRALDAATARLLAGNGPHPRPETEAWFASDTALRKALWGPGSATGGPGNGPVAPQDDAGSGGDAPNTRSAAVTVGPGTRHAGGLTGFVTDEHDWYAFDGKRGDVVNVVLAAALACVDLVTPAGTVVASGCAGGYASSGRPKATTLAVSGKWHLHVHALHPQTYTFGFGRNAAAPTVFP